MYGMKVAIQKIGNSFGIVLPKPAIAQLGLEDSVDLVVDTESGGLTTVRFGTFKELDDCECLDVTPMLEGSTFVVPRGA